MKKATLVLKDKAETAYRGKGVGACGSYAGELVFNTAMTGYVEALTDPSYVGQILTFAYPLIGNYGVSRKWFESGKIQPVAIVAHEVCQTPVHWQSEMSVSAWLEQNGVGGIIGVDTRAIVRKIRSQGTVPAVITVYEVVNPRGKPTVVVLDYGAKGSIAEQLVGKGWKVVIVPAAVGIREILAFKPAGIVLSNGPGDPAELTHEVELIRGLLLRKIPMWGICLGHQLLALARGGKSYKLLFGHRGVNQPVLQCQTRRAYITAQNHGYAIEAASLPSQVRVTFTNLNDGTVEGLEDKQGKWFSVQFHPEANPGPQDTKWLFDKFEEMVCRKRQSRKY